MLCFAVCFVYSNATFWNLSHLSWLPELLMGGRSKDMYSCNKLIGDTLKIWEMSWNHSIRSEYPDSYPRVTIVVLALWSGVNDTISHICPCCDSHYLQYPQCSIFQTPILDWALSGPFAICAVRAFLSQDVWYIVVTIYSWQTAQSEDKYH